MSKKIDLIVVDEEDLYAVRPIGSFLYDKNTKQLIRVLKINPQDYSMRVIEYPSQVIYENATLEALKDCVYRLKDQTILTRVFTSLKNLVRPALQHEWESERLSQIYSSLNF